MAVLTGLAINLPHPSLRVFTRSEGVGLTQFLTLTSTSGYMKNFFKSFVAIFAVTALLATSSFAGNASDPITCARQLRDCLKQCNQQEAAAKATKKSCDANATTAAAKKACRDAYNAAMAQVASCRATCKRNFDACIGGGYEG